MKRRRLQIYTRILGRLKKNGWDIITKYDIETQDYFIEIYIVV